MLLLSPSLLSHKRGWPERPCPSLPGSVQSCVYPDLDVLVERPAFPPAVCSLLSPPHHKGSVTQPSQVQRHHLLSATCREPQGEAPSALTPCGLQEGPERRWACVWTSPQPAWPGGSHGGSVSPLKAGQGHPFCLQCPTNSQAVPLGLGKAQPEPGIQGRNRRWLDCAHPAQQALRDPGSAGATSHPLPCSPGQPGPASGSFPTGTTAASTASLPTPQHTGWAGARRLAAACLL